MSVLFDKKKLPLIERKIRYTGLSPIDFNKKQSSRPQSSANKWSPRQARQIMTPSSNFRAESLDYSTIRVGHHARLEYFDNYKNLNTITHNKHYKQISETPEFAYLNEINKGMLNPIPFGLVKVKGPNDSIDIHNFSMGDNYANAFSEGISKLEEIKLLNLKENRLSGLASSIIVSKLEKKRTKKIVLSDNSLGIDAINSIVKLLNEEKSILSHLELENTKIGTKGVEKLCMCLCDNKTLIKLNLARNNIGDESSKYIKNLLNDNQYLKHLDLHWNNIKTKGCYEIFTGLSQNESLLQLDLSWNSIGKSSNLETAKIISDCLKTNTQLIHLDFSYNLFTPQECQAISVGLHQNHTLLGIHMLGNSCSIDAKGFIILTDSSDRISKTHGFRRINESFRHKSKTFGTNCWICEEWIEFKFIWNNEDLNCKEVFIHLECDGFKPQAMQKVNDSLFEISRAIPPREFNFFFSTKQGPALSTNIPTFELDLPLNVHINDQLYEISLVNTISPIGPTCNLKKTFKIKPRIAEAKQESPEELQRINWSIPISLFKDYTFDNDQLYTQGFEFDFKHTRIPKFVKNPEILEILKTQMKKFYKDFRETYRFLSAVCGNEVFSIGSNAFIDFLNQCNIFDKNYALSDVGVSWNAVNAQQSSDQLYNSGNGLCRYEFMEILVRIANDKYVRSKVCANPADAIEKLANDHLLSVMAAYDTNKWRFEKYLCEDVDLALKVHKPILDFVYNKYSGRKGLPGSKPYMVLLEFRALCNDAEMVQSSFGTREIDLCYSQAMMTQVDEIYKKKHLEMNFVEFLEAISRVADVANLPKKGEAYSDCRSLDLREKIENTMTYLLALCPTYIKDSFKFPTEETYRKMKFK